MFSDDYIFFNLMNWSIGITSLCRSVFPKSLHWNSPRRPARSHRQHLEAALCLDRVHISFFSLMVYALPPAVWQHPFSLAASKSLMGAVTSHLATLLIPICHQRSMHLRKTLSDYSLTPRLL